MPALFRPLEPGAPIGVVALSGPVSSDALAEGFEVLREMGHPVLVAPNLGDRMEYLAGADERRLGGLVHVLDGGARVIVAARGGYGVPRLLGRLPWERLVRDGVVFVGFSDLSSVLNHLVSLGGAVQIHGPMAAVDLVRPKNRERLQAVLEGRLMGRPLFRFGPGGVVRPGRACGHAAGGNLTVLCSTLGTPFEPCFEGSVLFLEEVGEPLYRLDRLLTQLRSSGRLGGVKALIGGSLRGCRPVSRRVETWNRLLGEAAPAGVPVVSGLAFGHGARNLAIPIGAAMEVDTGAGRITWSV